MLGPPLNSVLRDIDHIIAQADALKYRDFRGAIALGARAYALAVGVEYWSGACLGKYYESWGYLRLQEPLPALSAARLAFHIAEKHRLGIERAYALSALSGVGGLSDLEGEGLRYAIEQLEIARRHQHHELVYFALNDIADKYVGYGDYERALAGYLECHRYISDHNLPSDWMVECNIGDVYMALGHEDAVPWYERSLQSARTMDDLEGQVVAAVSLAKHELRAGSFERSEALLEQARESVHEASHLPLVLAVMAALCRARGDLDGAISILSGLLASESVQTRSDLLSDYHMQLADLYELKGDFRGALDHKKRGHDTYVRATQESLNKDIQLLRTAYEIDRAEKAVEEQREKKEAAERALEEHRAAEADRIGRERAEAALMRERELQASRLTILRRLAHEFRTPLAVIRSSTEMLLTYGEKMPQDVRARRQQTIEEQYGHFERLLRDMSSVMNVERERSPVNLQRGFQLASVVDQAVMEACKRTSSDRTRVQTRLDQDAVVDLSEDDLFEILVRLLSNALVFSQGSVYLHVRLQEDKLHLVVSDHGIGIPSDEWDAVFEPLVRGSNLDEQPGIGLGLTFARDAARRLKGTIEIESQVSEGTQVKVVVPHRAP